MSIQRIIYCSSAKGLDQEDIEAILESSERNNSANSVTGMLLFNAGCFMQLLEGSRDKVTSTFCRIANDPRHSGVELLSCKAVNSRLFGEWNMSYVSLTGDVGSLLRKYQSSGDFQPSELTDAAAESFCQECANLK